MRSLKRALTKSVREKIAFEVFKSADSSYTLIASKFGVSRTTVQKIAHEYNVARQHKSRPSGFAKGTCHSQHKRDVATVNWTFDDSLIKERIKRRENDLISAVHTAMKELERLS